MAIDFGRINNVMFRITAGLVFACAWLGAFAAEILPPGHRPAPFGVHALVGAKVIVKPGEVIPEGTVVVRDGFITAVGKDVEVPAEARVWPLKGLTVYAGFIEPYLLPGTTNPPVSTSRTEPVEGALTSGRINFFGVPGEEIDPGGRGPGYGVERISPERRIAESYTPNAKTLEALHELGFTAAVVVPETGLIRGSSTLVTLAPTDPNQALIKADVWQHVAFAPDDGRDGAFPRSLMGVVAAVRQALLDADYYRRDHAHYGQHPQGRKRPGFDPSLEALGKRLPLAFEPGSALMVDRAARIAREMDVPFLTISCGQEWRRPDLLQGEGRSFVVPVNFPEIPKLPEEDDWTQIALDQLRAWDWAASNPSVLRQAGHDVAFTTYGLGEKKNFRKKLRAALERGFLEEDAIAALTTVPARLCGVERQLGTIEPGKIANLTVVEGESYFKPEARIREVWVDGRVYPTKPAPGPKTNAVASSKTERTARSPLEGRGVLAAPEAVLIKGATLWTSGSQGRLYEADLLVLGGKISKVGKNLNAPANATVIEGQGKHVTPGLIDAHNHSMVLGGVNEATIPSSAMVRVADVVNSETTHLYRQLAGGLTVANLLHGSANPIGGQNCIIKLRDGALPEQLKFESAPEGIKFALGENVKQANWGDRNTTRFPQTRMGVGTFMANRFTAARQYLEAQKDSTRPHRRDLELEALGEILEGKRWVHCHSYRQDEILAFLRLMESFQVQVGTLQHVLEGYKVADEIARHGAGASSFSDWWAYKYEVLDAIPYAGSLMRERGVLVSFNSDSSDYARRMNLEAAKAVKYGGTTEEEALNFVTINPARQLRIEQRVGSLEAGKDGDFVIWSRSPLDSATVCLQTWVDGKKYFDVEHDVERTKTMQRERADLIAKAKRAAKAAGKSGAGDAQAENSFFEVALEHLHDAHDRHCLDEETHD